MNKSWSSQQEAIILQGMLEGKRQTAIMAEYGLADWLVTKCVRYLRDIGAISKKPQQDRHLKRIVDCMKKHDMDKQAVMDELLVTEDEINNALIKRGMKAQKRTANTVQRKCLYCKQFFRTPPKDLIFYCSSLCRKANKLNDGGNGDSISSGTWRQAKR